MQWTTTAGGEGENNCNKFLNCILFNAHSVFNKLPELHKVLYSHNYDCIFITESWLRAEYPDGMIDPQHHYTVYRSDRRRRRAGGVCVLIANQLRCQETIIPDSDGFEEDSIELLIFDIFFRRHKYRFMLIYRQPKDDQLHNNAAAKLCEIIGRHVSRIGPTFITGDLNCPNVDWTFGSRPTNISEQHIYDFSQSGGFVQCVPGPTRGHNLLDVVCTNEPMLVSTISVEPPFYTSDHDSVAFQLLIEGNVTLADDVRATQDDSADRQKRYLWSQGDYEAMAQHLSDVDWDNIFMTNLTPDDIWKAFCDQLDEVIELFVPSTECHLQPRANVRHYPRHIRRLEARRLAVWRTYKLNRTDRKLKERYRQLTADCKNAIRKHEVCMESKVIDSDNVGAFYNHVNKRLTSRSSVGTLISPGGTVAETDAQKAEVLNDYFASVCTVDDGNQPAFANVTSGDAGISRVTFDAAKLLAATRRIKTKCATSCGPDGYPVLLLRETIGAVARPLAQMFTAFMSVGKLPTNWKSATVTPIFKKDPSSDPSNYRPVSQTSVYCKLMERVMVADIIAYMSQNGFITKQQHGFLRGKSTETNLLETLSDWTIAIDNKTTQTVVYVDFSKVFDTVSHSKLLILYFVLCR